MSSLERIDPAAFRSIIATFRDAVRAHSAHLNRLNVYPVPDGDTGTNMSRTLDSVVDAMDAADRDHAVTCDAVSHGSLMGARGNSGVILSQVLRGFASTLKSTEQATPADLASALRASTDGAYQAVLKPIEGTILTVVRVSTEAAESAVASGEPLEAVVRAARDAGQEALDSTPDLLPVLRDAGVVDAGGAGYLLFLDALRNVVDGTAIPEPPPEAAGASAAAMETVAHRRSEVDGELDVSEYRYEVMYFLDLVDERIDDFKTGWGDLGDSIVVVGGDGLWNCHVHTNDIGGAIEVALDLDGRPKQIRVTDLFEEVDDEHARREAEMVAAGDVIESRAGAGLPPVTTAVVAVCSGDGLAELFGQLGVQGVVTGGQTMNPSTAELLDTVAAVNADQVVILPNNKNIIPVAEQVDALAGKDVAVVPTRSMPEALAALMSYDPEADRIENRDLMTEAAESVTTGELTRAVRDAPSEAGPVREGDWIGLVRSDGIVSTSESLVDAATALLDVIVGDDAELVTVITGAEADPAVTAVIEGWLRDNRGDVAAEVQAGGQPLYPYLFGVE